MIRGKTENMKKPVTAVATLHSQHDQGTLDLPGKALPVRADDLTGEDWGRLLRMRKVTHVDVVGSGWAFKPSNGEPTIPVGRYTVERFLTLFNKWETEGEDW